MKFTNVQGKHFEIDAFTEGYLEAALWSSTNPDADDRPMDDDFGIIDLSSKTIEAAKKDCQSFQEANADDLDASGLPVAEQGYLFWLNRNGHGVGFWDRPGGEVGDRLSDAAHDYGSVDLYVGDDGAVHGT